MEQIVTMPSMKRRKLLFAALGLPAFSFAARAGTGPSYSARLIGGETEGRKWRAGFDLTLDEVADRLAQLEQLGRDLDRAHEAP